MKEALGELEDKLDRVEELIDEPSGGEREERGMEPLMYTYDFMKSPDPKIIVAADAKKPTETVAARAFSLAESNFWLRNLKIRDYEALFARTIEDTNHPHLFNHDTPLGTAPKSRKRSITSQKATIWPFFAIFSSENTFYLVPRGCGSIKGVPWNHLTISKT